MPDARRLQCRRKEYKTAEGVLYATQTLDFIFQMSDRVQTMRFHNATSLVDKMDFIFQMSDRVQTMRFHNATSLVEKMEGGEWVLSTLDASGATTSGGVAGTSGESGTYSNPEIKKRRGIFLKMCQTPARLQSQFDALRS